MLWAMDQQELPARVEAVSIGSGERVAATPTLGTVAETAAAVAQLVNKMRAAFAAGVEQIERIGGPWCRYCAQLDGCPEGGAAIRVADS